MAYVPIDEEEEQQEQQGAEKVLSGQTSQVNAGSGQGSGGGAQSGSPKATSSGAGWTNLTRYVDANRGQDARMGGAMRDTYNYAAGKTQKGVDQFGSSARDTVDKATVRDHGVVDTLGKVGTDASQAPAEREAFKGHFANQLRGYQGPETVEKIEGYGETQRGVKKGVDEAGRAQRFEDRRGILSTIYGDPKYNAGEQRLDSFLVGAGQGGKSALNDIKARGNQLQSGWGELVNALSGDINTAMETSTKTQEDTEKAYGEAVTRTEGTLGGLESEVKSKNEQISTGYGSLINTLRSGDAGARRSAWQSVGVDPDAAEWLLSQGAAPDKIVAQGGQLGLGDLANDTLADDWGLLEELSGVAGGGPLRNFDFTKTGASGEAFNLNRDFYGKGLEAYGLKQDLEKRLQEHQAERNSEASLVRSGLVSFRPDERARSLQALGLSEGDLDLLAQRSFDPLQHIGDGTALNIGDVATDADRQLWANLINELGITPGMDLTDTQDEGAAFTFDRSTAAGIIDALTGGGGDTSAFADAYSKPTFESQPSGGGGGGGFGKWTVETPIGDIEVDKDPRKWVA